MSITRRKKYFGFLAETLNEALVSAGRIIIGVAISFARLFRGQMPFRDAFAGLVITFFTAALGCICLAGTQPDANVSHVEKAAAASNSHIDQAQELTGTLEIPSPATMGNATENPHTCCVDEATLDSMKSGEEVRVLMLHQHATPPDTTPDVPATHTPAWTISHAQATAVKPPSLVQLSISRT